MYPCLMPTMKLQLYDCIYKNKKLFMHLLLSIVSSLGIANQFLNSSTIEHVSYKISARYMHRHALRQHTLRHAGKTYKCGLPGCPTILRTENELRSHRLLVHETGNSDRQFRCSECPYSAKTRTQLRRHRTRHTSPADEKNAGHANCPFSHCNFTTKLTSHLKRHIRLHTGTKPYKCRHCTYASNNLENLRKHVLSTSLHPGKTIYECDVCDWADGTDPYSTNFAKELRAHLLEVHPAEFSKPSDASDHVARIFSTDGESKLPSSDVNNRYEDSINAPKT